MQQTRKRTFSMDDFAARKAREVTFFRIPDHQDFRRAVELWTKTGTVTCVTPSSWKTFAPWEVAALCSVAAMLAWAVTYFVMK